MKFGYSTNRICQKALDYYSKGNCKKLLNDYNGAISDFTKAIQYNPNFAEAYYRRGNTRVLLNDNEGALSDYDKAIELNPELAKTLNNRGLTN
jgi:tetratricopeptide (TPR) repeat protein